MTEMIDPLADLKAEQEAGAPAGDAPKPEEVAKAQEAAAEAEAQASTEETKAEAGADETEAKVEADGKDKAEDGKKNKRTSPVPAERFNEVYGKYHAERSAREAAEAEKARLEALVKELSERGQKEDPADKSAQTKTEAELRAEIERKVRADIEQEAAVQAFNDAANKAYEAGVKKFGQDGFTEALGDLQRIGLSNRPDVVQVALDTGNAEQVLYLLGQDISEAERVMALSPTRMAVEMTKLAGKRLDRQEPRQQPVSKAADPIRPVKGGGGEADADLAHLDMDSFVREFDRIMEKRPN